MLVEVELWSDGEIEAVFPGGADEMQKVYGQTLHFEFERDIGSYLRGDRRSRNPLLQQVCHVPWILAMLVSYGWASFH